MPWLFFRLLTYHFQYIISRGTKTREAVFREATNFYVPMLIYKCGKFLLGKIFIKPSLENYLMKRCTVTLPFRSARAVGYYPSKETFVCWKCDMKLPTIPSCLPIRLAVSQAPRVAA